MKFAVRYLKNTFYPLNVPETIKLEDGQMVVVRTEKGEEALKVFIVNSEIEKLWENSKNKPEPLPVIRTLSQRDLQTLEDIKREEVEAFFKCQALVRQHKLGMNLVQCRITFDRRKITFYYTAPERVDFRALLKDLTQTFTRVRIDLRHIGVRDETSILEGVGICGQPFCCSSFLRKFATINVSDLEVLDNGTTVTVELLKSKNIISKIEPYGLKVLGNGNLTKKLNVQAAKFTDGAAQKITAAGGTIEVK